MKEPRLLRPSSPPASTPPGRMSTMALPTLSDSASLVKSLAALEPLVLLTLDSHKSWRLRLRLETRRMLLVLL